MKDSFSKAAPTLVLLLSGQMAKAAVSTIFIDRTIGFVQRESGVSPGGTNVGFNIYATPGDEVLSASLTLPTGVASQMQVANGFAAFNDYPRDPGTLETLYPSGAYSFDVTTRSGNQRFDIAVDATAFPEFPPAVTNLAALSNSRLGADTVIRIQPLRWEAAALRASLIVNEVTGGPGRFYTSDATAFDAGILTVPAGTFYPGGTYGALIGYLRTSSSFIQGAQILTTARYSSSAIFKVSSVAPPVTGVPEPASWAMLITGFGLVGMSARRRLTKVAA